MTIADHRAEAERTMREHSTYGLPSTEAHLLAAIHDELRAIRDHVVPTPPEPEPLAVWERDLLLARSPHTETERLLLAECDRLRAERDRARTQVISLTGERDDLRDRVPTDDEVVVKREDLHYAVTVLDALDPFLDAESERWLTRLRAALGGDDR